MARVVSRDGTSIVYERVGDGPVVVLVGGGLDDGTENGPLAQELAEDFTAVNYARRGRAGSGDVQPYALEREIEDLAALIDAVGGPAHLFGASSGGALALEAAAAGLPIGKLAVFEVPYAVGGPAVEAWQAYVTQLRAALADGRRDEAVKLFMRLAGVSEQDIAGAESSPMWSPLLELAHTLAYDAACLGDGPPPAARLATITQPTLALTGSGVDPHMAGLQSDFFSGAADAIAACVARAERRVVEVREHTVNAKALAPVLTDFFRS
ncbi:alpha/beta fold hydrolase [Nonomuraea sp. MCN248]|uniref:Alpha/beta fold hydrolase n=1 Tax=Nonomuraea corallina TaxID=2989783 RepID=A0ABT4S8E5_9ACTN|nr:alpha/beta fold hydrolase [Nonomuraea corallina]MDA0633507.1 alpha/beta fold hydrolase [Nonomuraea corallina]